ncbi:MAG: hypothetical protein EOM26_10250 [Alphaproteobacteria bacterium]|nr:hypothetical protein [Alphaproteobacteria bacterium]
MSLNNLQRGAIGLSFLTVAGCTATTGPVLNDTVGGGMQSSPVQNLPGECTVVTQREGSVTGNRQMVPLGDGKWEERCVYSNSRRQRDEGTAGVLRKFPGEVADGVSREVSRGVQRAVREGMRSLIP